MKKRPLFRVLTALYFANTAGAALSGDLTLDSGLAYTTNANLVQTNPESDAIVKVGGAWRFPFSKGSGRLSLRYSDYLKHSENDLLSCDLSTSWKTDAPTGTPTRTYGLRFQTRNYLKQDVGTTDQGFTHYGMVGNITFNPSSAESAWSYTPQFDIEYYPNLKRTDLDLSFSAEYDSFSDDVEQEFSLSLTPGFLFSTSNEFSKAYLSLSADYEASLNESSTWGSGIEIIPSIYLSRATESTVLTTVRKKRGLGSTTATVISEKEVTLLFSPLIWYSHLLSSDWQARFELFGNFQNSKSDTYNYREFLMLGSLQYRIF